ncbi:MAG: outer membrane lipid asymmetry maintenance protein MlaD [Legionellales bacterium]|nr:outer membrane lipid asymmetry maintenance protein MlaD [Legionellales bacterium]
MHKRTVELAVGFLMLIAGASLLMLAIQVSGLTDFFNSDDGYLVTADFDNIGGLKVRSRVTLAGVPVGRVISIDLDNDEYLARVTMVIDSSVKNIPEDSQASILTAGLLGDNYVGLSPGFSENYLNSGSHIDAGNTISAVILEELISRFLAGQASQ